jgi:hypothetical protein
MRNLVFCTLLGPEGPGRHPSGRLLETQDLHLTGIRSRLGRYRPYFENYTVDASILDRDFVSITIGA